MGLPGAVGPIGPIGPPGRIERSIANQTSPSTVLGLDSSDLIGTVQEILFLLESLNVTVRTTFSANSQRWLSSEQLLRDIETGLYIFFFVQV